MMEGSASAGLLPSFQYSIISSFRALGVLCDLCGEMNREDITH